MDTPGVERRGGGRLLGRALGRRANPGGSGGGGGEEQEKQHSRADAGRTAIEGERSSRTRSYLRDTPEHLAMDELDRH